MNKEISVEVRQIIIKLYYESKSMGEIGEIIGKPKSSVQYIIKNYGSTGSLKSKPRSGRPKILSDLTNRNIIREVKKNPRKTAAKIGDEIRNKFNISVSDQTIRNVLRKGNYNSRFG